MTDAQQIIYLPSPSKLRTILMIVGTVIAVLVILAIGYYLKKLFDENAQLRTEVTEFKQLTETLVRSSTKWATKEDLDIKLNGLLTKEDREALQRDLKEIKAILVAVGSTVGSIGKKVSELENSDKEGTININPEKCADGRLIDKYSYTKAPQIKEMTDLNKAPLAEVVFDAANEKPWKYSIYERKFYLTTAVGKQESGQLAFYHTLNYDVPEKSNQKYGITLTSSEYIQVPQFRQMFWWNPLLDIGVFAGGNVYSFMDGLGNTTETLAFGAELGISFSSYGYSRVDNLWKFFRFGLGYDAERRVAHLSFSPIMFNIGDPIPLITNLWIYPFVGADSGGGLTFGAGVGFQL